MLAAWALADRRLGVRALGAVLLAARLAARVVAARDRRLGGAARLAPRGVPGDGRARRCSARPRSLAFYAVLAAATGFDPIGTLRATEQVYRFGIADQRPYWFWLTGSPSAFLLMLGLPVAWLAFVALARGEDTAIAILAVLGIAARRRLHQGRGRADLAAVRAARLPRRGDRAARARPAPGARAARRPGARLGAPVEHRLVTQASGRRYSTMSIPIVSCANGAPVTVQPSRS